MEGSSKKKRKSGSCTHSDYTVGWVCALRTEQTAATAMLDQRHPDLPKPHEDPNTYTLGSIGEHNVVVTCLPLATIGNSSSAAVAATMVATFPSIKFGLMVGIGGGVPSKVRLGDIVVSTPIGQYPGVVQWDLGKTKQTGEKDDCFERTGLLAPPPRSLLTALTKLQTEHEMNGPKLFEHLEAVVQKSPHLATKYRRSAELEDLIFPPDVVHSDEALEVATRSSNVEAQEEAGESCRYCDKSTVLKGGPQETQVHYGLIASGNQVIKSAKLRDAINKDLGGNFLCFEMEAAGLMNTFPCLVIRGICDYADSHKTKRWQEYAAGVAAAFAKELLGYVQPSDIAGEHAVKDVINSVLENTLQIKEDVGLVTSKLNEDEDDVVHDWLTKAEYGPQHSDHLKRRQEGTGQWFLDSAEYKAWVETRNRILFCPGMPGAGKTIMSAIVVQDLIKQFQNDPAVGIAYVYCNFKRKDEQSEVDLLASLLKQLSRARPEMPGVVKELYENHRKYRTRPSLLEISRALQSVAILNSKTFLIIDAVDECEKSNGRRNKFLSEIFELETNSHACILATSRDIPDITDRFDSSVTLEIRATNDDVSQFVHGQMLRLPKFVQDDQKLCEEVMYGIIQAVDGMFLLAQLNLDSIANEINKSDVRNALKRLPTGSEAYNQAYRDTMKRIDGQVKQHAKLALDVLLWITRTKRPLTTTEMQHALAMEPGQRMFDDDKIPALDILISVCAGLVVVDDESGVVRLVHYTAQQFFENAQHSWFSKADSFITTICTTYLSMDVFESGVCLSDADFEARLMSYPFYDYCATYWGHHARSDGGSGSGVLELLSKAGHRSAASQALYVSQGNRIWDNYSQWIPKLDFPLHFAAYLGLGSAVRKLLRHGRTSTC